MEILWPIIVLTIMGIVLAVALTLANKFLQVKEDTRIGDVEALLPGVNCGACGYPGCRGFAEAIINGEVKNLSRCRPGNADKNYNPIIAYLKDNPNEDGSLVDVKI
jgi:electron transport complex protein RnfB